MHTLAENAHSCRGECAGCRGGAAWGPADACSCPLICTAPEVQACRSASGSGGMPSRCRVEKKPVRRRGCGVRSVLPLDSTAKRDLRRQKGDAWGMHGVPGAERMQIFALCGGRTCKPKPPNVRHRFSTSSNGCGGFHPASSFTAATSRRPPASVACQG